jgi:hypothetical protein
MILSSTITLDVQSILSIVSLIVYVISAVAVIVRLKERQANTTQAIESIKFSLSEILSENRWLRDRVVELLSVKDQKKEGI